MSEDVRRLIDAHAEEIRAAGYEPMQRWFAEMARSFDPLTRTFWTVLLRPEVAHRSGYLEKR